ncbi:MAG: hypothetical protein K9G49_05735 [Taibaiella sp.]|nr:hypothetical protein [Taibaiella sp.]
MNKQKSNVPMYGMLLVLAAFLCQTVDSIAQEFNHIGDEKGYGYYARKDCQFVYTKPTEYDTIIVIDPITKGVKQRLAISNHAPQSVNGQKIYRRNEVSTMPNTNINNMPLEEYLLDGLKDYLTKQVDDSLTLLFDMPYIAVDDKGRIIYYELYGTKGWGTDGTVRTLSNRGLDDKIEELFSKAPPLKPATYNGRNVAAYLRIDLDAYEVDIFNHTFVYRKIQR